MTTTIIPHGFEVNYTLGFVKGLQENGVDVCVISSDADAPLLNAAGIRNVNLRGSLAEDRGKLQKARNLFLYYAALIGFLIPRRGVIHFSGIFRNEFILIEGIFVHLILRALASRYIYTAHNVLPHARPDSQWFRLVYRLIYRVPHVILVNTPLAAQQLIEEFGVARHRVVITSIGLNEEIPLTDLTREAARQRLGLHPTEKVVLFFGKIEPYKGLDLLIEAFEQTSLPDATLVIAGAFPQPAYRDAITSTLRRCGARDRIRLVDRDIPNDDVEGYFKSGDVLVLPYRKIYQSGVIFLAMRFGIPVIATPVGSLRDYIEGDMGIITEGTDAAAVAAAIQRFFDQPQLFCRDRIAAKGERYRWVNICRDLLPLYQ